MLIILGGLPGVGKTTIARALARELSAVHVRIDSIEQAIRDSGVIAVSLDDAGYRVGYAVAEDNLRLGRVVIADSVNPLAITRDAWLNVATRCGVPHLEVEIVCSDSDEHRRRVEGRRADIVGATVPTWQQVTDRTYDAWHRPRVVIDTAMVGVAECIKLVRAALTPQIRNDTWPND